MESNRLSYLQFYFGQIKRMQEKGAVLTNHIVIELTSSWDRLVRCRVRMGPSATNGLIGFEGSRQLPILYSLLHRQAVIPFLQLYCLSTSTYLPRCTTIHLTPTRVLRQPVTPFCICCTIYLLYPVIASSLKNHSSNAVLGLVYSIVLRTYFS